MPRTTRKLAAVPDAAETDAAQLAADAANDGAIVKTDAAEIIVADDAEGNVTATGELLSLDDDALIDAAAGPAPDAEPTDAKTDTAPRRTRARKSAAAAAAEPTPVKVSIHIGADGNFKIHKPGCRDIKREIGDHPHVEDSVHVAEYATVEQIIRGEWSDQIGDNWDYAQGDPSLDYLAEHGFVDSVDVLPCIARKLVPLAAAEPQPRRARAARPAVEPKHRADLGALDSIAGYVVVKSTPGFDQLKRSDLGDSLPNAIADETAPDAAAADRPEWLTRCNYHGKTTVAPNRKAGRGLGSSGARAEWCSGCKRAAKSAADAAAKTDAAADATAEHDAAAKSE